MYFHNLTLLILGVILSNYAVALSNDHEQPIQIEADKATIDNIKGIAIYEGNVIVTQGSIRINAETVTLNYTPKQDIEKVIAVGKPVRFKQRLDSGDDIQARSREMEYNAVKNMLHLRKKAILLRQRNKKDLYTVNAPRITYDIQRATTQTDKGNTGSGRTTITIQPQSKSSSKK